MKLWKKGLAATALLGLSMTMAACGNNSDDKSDSSKEKDGDVTLKVTTPPLNLKNCSALLKLKILALP